MRYTPPAFLAPPPPAVAIPTRVRADADCCGVGVARCRVEGKPLAGRRSSWGGPALPANDPPLGQQPGVVPPGRLPAPVAGLHAPHPISDQGMPYLVSTQPCVAKVCKRILGLVRPRTPPSRARTLVPACLRPGLRCRPCPGAGLRAKRAAERRRIRRSGLSQRTSAADQAVGTAHASHPGHHLHHSVSQNHQGCGSRPRPAGRRCRVSLLGAARFLRRPRPPGAVLATDARRWPLESPMNLEKRIMVNLDAAAGGTMPSLGIVLRPGLKRVTGFEPATFSLGS